MITLYQKTWNEINIDIAHNFKRLRKRKKVSQKELSLKADVSLGSIKRFEQTGEVSLQSLTKLAMALEVETEMEQLFAAVPFSSIEEIINEQDQ